MQPSGFFLPPSKYLKLRAFFVYSNVCTTVQTRDTVHQDATVSFFNFPLSI
jgi:hypothetical protein